MNTKEWADKLNGREYRNELTQKEIEQAKDDGIIIVFGFSDDLLWFRGFIDEEIGAFNGTTVKITKDLTIFNEDENYDTLEYNKKEINKMPMVKAIWCPESNGEVIAAWGITTHLPNENFQIYEDDELYCIGVIFHKDSVLNYIGE